MKKLVVSALLLAMTMSLFGCGSGQNAQETSEKTAGESEESASAVSGSEESAAAEQAADESIHTIGVLTYSRTDEESLAFADYLNNYIADCFNVKFVYSDSVTSEEEEMSFLAQCAENGVEGIMSFDSYDLKEEADFCQENGMYYMMASGSVSEEAFDLVSDNPYFLGVIGPGSEVEYSAGAEMAAYFADQAYGDDYFILSGGASMGNEMHLQRTIGILDTLEDKYGVTFDESTEDLAASAEITHVSAGNLTVCLVPGYMDFDVFLEPAIEEYEKDQFTNVLSVLPGSAMEETLLGAHVGIIDCFTESNLLYFDSGELCYVAGKYGSIIGPSFAAMYNAVTGHADEFREDGKAFQVEQGFWTATDTEDYHKKYTLAASKEITAYNFDDLYNVCSEYNPDANLDDLKALAAAYTYEEVVARRGVQ